MSPAAANERREEAASRMLFRNGRSILIEATFTAPHAKYYTTCDLDLSLSPACVCFTVSTTLWLAYGQHEMLDGGRCGVLPVCESADSDAFRKERCVWFLDFAIRLLSV